MSRGDFPSAKQDQFVLRLPDGLRDQIKASAEAEGRSMNSEIVLILQRHYAYKRVSQMAEDIYTETGRLIDPPQ